MEVLVIQVDCVNPNGPPQLGIEVQAPCSSALQQQQQHSRSQQVAKEYRNHDYQNLDDFYKLPSSKQKNAKSSTNNNGKLQTYNALSGIDMHRQSGLQITKIQENSVIARCGKFKIDDIIVEVNGVDLQRLTFRDAQNILRGFVVQYLNQGLLELKVLRKSASSSSIPSTAGSQTTVIERFNSSNMSPNSNSTTSNRGSTSASINNNSPLRSNSARHLVGALNTRRIGTRHTIELKKDEVGGFGIKIAERDNMVGKNSPIYVTVIKPIGSAYRDGRLKEGDMILSVNGIDLTGKSQPEVAMMLKSVGIGETVEFVVSRQEDPPMIEDPFRDYVNTDFLSTCMTNGCDTKKKAVDILQTNNHQFEKKVDSLLDVPNIDGPGTYVYDIPINEAKFAGLGLALKYPKGKDLGTWIKVVITGGAAWKDGRLQPDDEILAVNGISLVGLSKSDAENIFTSASSRGAGPDATPNTVRLHIHRRDPAAVAKILHGTNDRIENCDLTKKDSKSLMNFDKSANNTRESYQTAFDNTIHCKSLSSNDTTSSSSNQNSHNDSALSPQTQASNSLKMTGSNTDKSDLNNSDKTNDTSSAISQITDFTTVPINENSFTTQNGTQSARTLPKTLELDNSNQTLDAIGGAQSWDDESVSSATGEEHFQRDGFGRQSISEKRHAQIMAQNTDTFKRNQKMREERERQKRLEEQMARQTLDDGPVQVNSNDMTKSVTAHDMRSIYDRTNSRNQTDLIPRDDFSGSYRREVPVDVHVPYDPNIHVERFNENNHSDIYGAAHYMTNFSNSQVHQVSQAQNRAQNDQFHQQQHSNISKTNQCRKCGLTGQCICNKNSAIEQDNRLYGGVNYGFDPTHKRSNSLESIQHNNSMLRNGLIVPRSGTVRVARNRKINESFRAAVDRSYDSSINNSIRLNQSTSDQRKASNNYTKVTSSICNSTTSTFNDERLLINNTQSNNGTNSGGTQKKTSLLTKFLKFGSMKKKKRNKDSNQPNAKATTETSSSSRSNLERDTQETTRSHTSKGSHSRTQSSQSQPKNGAQNFHNSQCPSIQPMSTKQQYKQQAKQTNNMGNQFYAQNLEQPVLHPHQMQSNSIDIHHNPQTRAQMHVYPYQHLPPNMHYQQNQPSNLQPYVAQLNMAKQNPQLPLRPSVSAANIINNPQQYSHLPMNHQIHPHQDAQFIHQQGPVDLNSHQAHYQAIARNQMVQPSLGQQNCFQNNTHWQSPVHQAPNGLWVANSPPNDGIYGVNGHHQQHIVNMHNHHQQPVPISHSSSYIPSVNNSNSNGIHHHHQIQAHHQSPYMQGAQNQALTQQHLHNQQPQHIYYYDF